MQWLVITSWLYGGVWTFFAWQISRFSYARELLNCAVDWRYNYSFTLICGLLTSCIPITVIFVLQLQSDNESVKDAEAMERDARKIRKRHSLETAHHGSKNFTHVTGGDNCVYRVLDTIFRRRNLLPIAKTALGRTSISS